MLNFCRKNDGTIAVFLTLILIPMFIFSGVMVDGSRIIAGRNLVSEAGDLSMNAALSNYHEQLNEMYGLLAMADTAEEIESIMQDCFEVSLNASGVSQEDFSKALVYLELTEGGFSASNIVDTEIYQTDVIKQEVLEYMKYRAPVTLISRAMEGKIEELETSEEEKEAADAEIKFEKEMGDVQDLLDELNELVDQQVQYVNGIDNESSLNALLAATKSNYDEITMLTVAYYRMRNCTDCESGDMRELMERMKDLDCDVSNITEDTASNIIKMIRIANTLEEQNPSDLLDGLAIGSEEYSETQNLISEYENAKSNMEKGIENTGHRLDELVKNSYNAMHEQWECASKGSENCTAILEKLTEIREKLADCEGKYVAWQNAVDNLSNDQSKRAYQESIDEVSGLFENNGIIGDFEDKIVNNKIYFDEVVASLDLVEFSGWRIDYEVSSKAVFYEEADYGQIIESSEISSAADDFMSLYYSPETVTLSVEISKDVDERDAFIHKLKEEYCNTDSADAGQADAQKTHWKEELNNKKTELVNLFTTQDIPDDNVMSMANSDLPSVWLGIAQGESYDENSVQIEGNLDDNSSRKKASERGSSNMNQDNVSLSEMASLGSKVAGFAMDVLEPLYYTEYVMGMFSYYTVNRDREGNEIDSPESLSRAALNENAIYRAEIEYILWGSPSIRSNINKTKAIIFAANFVFNMSFAFTNSRLNNQARNIAFFFPVGALGRIAIKCALLTIVATIETVDNMIDLMNGKAVPLIKQENKWKTWLLGAPGSYNNDGSGFTYEDYLWILVCVNMYIPSQQTKLLGRTADCIELNLTDKKANNANTLKDMYTMISVEASVSVDTFFMQRLGNAGYDVSYDSDDFKVDYYGIQGY